MGDGAARPRRSDAGEEEEEEESLFCARQVPSFFGVTFEGLAAARRRASSWQHGDVEEARSSAARRRAGPPPRVDVYAAAARGRWAHLGASPAQDLADLFLPRETLAPLLEHVDGFGRDEARYGLAGKPHKLGLVLVGPPGAGKTSLVKALALRYGRALYLLHLSRKVEDEDFLSLMREVAHKSIVLLEDVDSAGLARRSAAQAGRREVQVSRSCLLHVLDGVVQPRRSAVFVLTANDAACLDRPLARPGGRAASTAWWSSARLKSERSWRPWRGTRRPRPTRPLAPRASRTSTPGSEARGSSR